MHILDYIMEIKKYKLYVLLVLFHYEKSYALRLKKILSVYYVHIYFKSTLNLIDIYLHFNNVIAALK